MVKAYIIWVSAFVVICLSSASLKLGLTDRQFTLKSFNESTHEGNLYKPLKIHTRVIEESISDDKINKDLSLTLAASGKILSDLILTKSSLGKIRPGEKIMCNGAFLTQIIQRENIDADIAVFLVSTLEEDKTISSTKCELVDNKFIKAVVVEINAEKFIKLEKISQVREICIEISNVLYGSDEEERKILANQIDEYLDKEKAEPVGNPCANGQNYCIKCEDTNNCLTCQSGYYPLQVNCRFCSPTTASTICSQCANQCTTCSLDASYCTKCIDKVHMSVPDCACPNNSVLNGVNCVCNQGYYFSSNTVCSSCASNCATCSGSSKNCITCSDSLHMSAAPACACSQKTHILAGRCVSDSQEFNLSSD